MSDSEAVPQLMGRLSLFLVSTTLHPQVPVSYLQAAKGIPLISLIKWKAEQDVNL